MWMTVSLAAAGILIGCRGPGAEELHYLGDEPVQYYRETASEIAYPEVYQAPPEEVAFTNRPRTLSDLQEHTIWDLTLDKAIKITLANASVIRQAGQFRSPGNTLLNTPDRQPSIYDPALQATGFTFGNRGVEAALADFDAQFTTRMIWGRNELIPNNAFFGGGISGNTLQSDTGSFESALSKQFANGGSLRVFQNWDYQFSNSPAQLFPSAFTGNTGAEYRQPLWAGAGTEFTRIAGALPPGFRNFTGVNQGVVIARINEDISLAEFQANVRNLVKDVEDAYWTLYLRYRIYDAAVTARNSALRSWREAQARLEVGGVANFKPADEAQARDRYFETRAQVEEALGGPESIYSAEIRLRRLLGLPVNDGRLIRPVTEPTKAELSPHWEASLSQALTERVELRKQKWNIKSLQLQLKAAESLTNPRLDFVSSYRINAIGDRLFGENDNDVVGTPQGLDSGFETLTQGDQTGWNLGFEFSMPFGFRQAHAQVRNLELRLAKARDVLAAQELEISHELARAVQDLIALYQTSQTYFNRLQAARRRVELFEAELEAGTATLDEVLRAQAALAEAETAYYRSLIGYNQAIADFFFRKGALLEHNNVFLAEGGWDPKAYQLALRRAVARSHALENPVLGTEPKEFVLPGAPVPPEMAEGPDDGGAR